MAKDDVYEKLSGKVHMPHSRWIPMILKKLISPQEGEMLLALPLTVSEFAEKYRVDEVEAERTLEEFANKGVCIPLDKHGELKYNCVNNIIQVHDATIHGALNKNYEPVPFEIIEMWKHFRETEWLEILKVMEKTPPPMRGRCIPSWSTVRDEPELKPIENLRTILKEAPAIAVVDCPCRWLQVERGECDKPTFACFSLTKGSVQYIVDRRIGKQLTLEEGYDVLEQCEQTGLIPTAGGNGQPRQICMCSAPECIILRAQTRYGYDLWDRSRFDATVDTDRCEGCETCIDRCQMSAVTMKNDVAEVDAEKCFGCGICVVTCPSGALSMKLARPIEHITEGPTKTNRSSPHIELT